MILLSHNPFYQALVGGLAALLAFVLFYGIFFLISLLFIKKKRNNVLDDAQVQGSKAINATEEKAPLVKPNWKKRILKTIRWIILIAACITAAAIAITEYNRHQEYVDKLPVESPEYIADNTIKTLTLESNGKEYVIYKDYYWKHTICLENNLISFHSYYGAGNGWKPDYMLGDEHSDSNLGIKDWGKLSNIEEINDSTIYYDCIESVTNLGIKQYDWCLRYEDNSKYHTHPYAICYSSIGFKPLHGYEVAFRVGDERNIKRLRIYPTHHKLDDEDKLRTVTLQYQLF